MIPGASLLIADDDPGLLRLTSRILGREGFRVATASSGEEAIAWLEGERPDLLLLDLKLNDVDARQMISRLRESGRLPDFVIITGQGDERVAVEMMKHGALDYLVKDADFLELLPARVHRVIEQIERVRKLEAAERALRLSEQRFRIALEDSPITVFNQDAQLRYTWVHNPFPARTHRDHIGRTDEDLFSRPEADLLTAIKSRVLATGVGSRQEVQCTVDGERRFYDLNVEPVRDRDGQTIGIAGAATDITEHRRLEREISHISEIEQRRIGQDLHDGICQHLTGIELLCQALEQGLGKKSRALATQASAISKHVRDVISQTRSLARGLSPLVLGAEGLMVALAELASSTESLFPVKCRFVNEGPVLIHDSAVATHLYRIAQEAVTNAIKHGKAPEVHIRLAQDGSRILLSITDNGRGFGDNTPGRTGMGLHIMQYRADMISATLSIQSTPQQGATIMCSLSRNSVDLRTPESK
ncbi:MAG TPA: response regulator [Chthoniobacterales bacterium]